MRNLFPIPVWGRKYIFDLFFSTLLSALSCDFMHFLIFDTLPALFFSFFLKREREKADLKLNILKTKIMATGPITSWQIEGEKSGSSDKFYFPGLQNHCRQ